MNKKIVLITPATRPQNLKIIFKSINWNYISRWIIVYDKKIIHKNPFLFKKNKNITELINLNSRSIRGSGQRNMALKYLDEEKIDNSYIYFLDDDNIIHPNFYKVCKKFKNKKIYTFNQQVKIRYIRKGNKIKLNFIDTAMFVLDYDLAKKVRWRMQIYETDYYFIKTCLKKNNNKYVYINETGCYYNYLADNFYRRNLKRFKTYIYNNIIKF